MLYFALESLQKQIRGLSQRLNYYNGPKSEDRGNLRRSRLQESEQVFIKIIKLLYIPKN